MKTYVFTAALLLGLSTAFSTSMARADKATDIPACASIAKSCEAAGYEPGDHKKNGKGLWVDCIHRIAKGKTVAGVSATEAEAKSCLEAHKAMKKK